MSKSKPQQGDNPQQSSNIQIPKDTGKRNLDVSRQLSNKVDKKQYDNLQQHSDLQIMMVNNKRSLDVSRQLLKDADEKREKLAKAAEPSRDNPKTWSDSKISEDHIKSPLDISRQLSKEAKTRQEKLSEIDEKQRDSVNNAELTNIKDFDRNNSISKEKNLGIGDDHPQHAAHNDNKERSQFVERENPTPIRYLEQRSPDERHKVYPIEGDNYYPTNHIEQGSSDHIYDAYPIEGDNHYPTKHIEQNLSEHIYDAHPIEENMHHSTEHLEQGSQEIAAPKEPNAKREFQRYLSVDKDAIAKREEAIAERARVYRKKVAEDLAKANGQEPPEQELPKWERLTEEQLNNVPDARYETYVHEVTEILQLVESLQDSIIAIRPDWQEQQIQVKNYKRDRNEIEAPNMDNEEDHLFPQKMRPIEILKREDKENIYEKGNEDHQSLSEQEYIFEDEKGSSIEKEKIKKSKPHTEIQKKAPLYFVIALYEAEKARIEQELAQVGQKLVSHDQKFEGVCKEADYELKRGDFNKERAVLIQQTHQLHGLNKKLDVIKSKIEQASEDLEKALEKRPSLAEHH